MNRLLFCIEMKQFFFEKKIKMADSKKWDFQQPSILSFFWFTYNEFDRSLHLMCRWEVVNIWSARFQSFGLGFRHGYLWGVADLIIELVYISWMTIWRPSLHVLDSTIHPCIVICHSKVPLDIPGIDRKYIFINFAGGWVTQSSKEL